LGLLPGSSAWGQITRSPARPGASAADRGVALLRTTPLFTPRAGLLTRRGPPRGFSQLCLQDAAAARRVCGSLRAAGIEVWFDQSELRGGDAWDQSIRRQIKECALFIPLISASTQARAEGYFRREWKLAVERTHDMADHVPFLLPVLLDATKDREAHVPEKFREVQWTALPDGLTPPAFCARVQALLQGVPTAGARGRAAGRRWPPGAPLGR